MRAPKAARCKVILKEKIFGIPRVGTFVMHPGICPEYRNAHGCFWALVRRDLERVGMTLLRGHLLLPMASISLRL